jgi:hypothetical protein
VVRGAVVLVVGVLLLAGCGDGPQARTAAPVLVFFQRQGAAGATLDTVTVRNDGSARLEKRYGGAGGRFKDLALRSGQLPRLKAALARLGPADTLSHGAAVAGRANYLMRYRGRTLTGQEGSLVPRARAAVRLLDGFIDGIGVGRPTRETATNAP